MAKELDPLVRMLLKRIFIIWAFLILVFAVLVCRVRGEDKPANRLQITGTVTTGSVSGFGYGVNGFGVFHDRRLFSNVYSGTVSIGGGYRKIGAWPYDGHELLFQGNYRHDVPMPKLLPYDWEKNWSVGASAGLAYQITPTVYNFYAESRDNEYRLISYESVTPRRSKLMPASGADGARHFASLNPFISVSLERRMSNRISLGAGFRSTIRTFEIRRAQFDSITQAVISSETDSQMNFSRQFFYFAAYHF